MNFREIFLLYSREFRAALRERNIVINSILLPILLYPILLWGLFSAFTFVRGQEDRFVSRIALVDEATLGGVLEAQFAEEDRVEWVEALPQETAKDQLRAGDLDAFAEVLPQTEIGTFSLRVTYNSSKDRSVKAHERLREALGEHRVEWFDERAEALGIEVADWRQFTIETRNEASSREMGSFVLGMMVPLLMIIMIAVGCFYPAVDATAGERERSTWETLMTTGASRSSIITAKYLYVATFGIVAGLLNLLAMVVSMRGILGPLLGGAEEELDFGIPWEALPILGLAAVLLAFFLAAGMMLFAAFARTFKEGQSMVGPFYLISILPTMVVQSPDLALTPKMALIPIVNVALLCREAIAGTFNWPMIGLTLVVEILLIVLCLALARWILRFEDVLVGSYSGSLGKFLQQRLKGRRSEQRGSASTEVG